MVWPIIVGCNTSPKIHRKTPNGYSDPPESILCTNCGNKTHAIYKQDDFYFSICFLNCCRLQKGVPYLCCKICENSFGAFGTKICNNCNTAVPSQFLYCPTCGRPDLN